MIYTIDVKESWSESFAWPFQGVSLNECNLAIHSDGGSRRDSCSASAWIIEAGTYIDEKWTYRIAARGGTFMERPESSFLVEAIALEEASRYVCKYVRQDAPEPQGKRIKIV